MLPWIIGMAAVSAAGALSSASQANSAASTAQANAARRYELQAGIAEDQIDEQNQLAVEKMTDVTRAFIQAKGKAKAIQSETMVTGATSKRIEANTRSKFSEAKGKVAREIDTNIVNIAQSMIAKKIDTEAIISEAESKKKNVFTETALGALQGGISGYSLASSIGAKATTPTTSVTTNTTGVTTNTTGIFEDSMIITS